jgi:hypothetical integral membrane protein (TIGR02206 family)
MERADRFTPYGASHLAVLGLLLLGVCVLVLLGRARRGREVDVRTGRGLAVVILAIMLPVQAHLLVSEPDLERALPLQLCDVAWMVAAYALWTRRRWAVAVTYYWGLSLTPQAVLTPELGTDFPQPAFLAFWAMHLLVVWAAVHLTWGAGLRPDWGSFRTALVVTACWAVVAFAVNLAAGTNFGYLNAKPRTASVLDLFGDWPVYVAVEAAVVAAGWALMTWPWVLRRARV